MKFHFIPYCLLLALSIVLLPAVKAQYNINDSLALVDLYNSTNGPSWLVNKNWLSKKPVNTWFGVDVYETRVTKIELDYNNLTGKLPPTIGNLKKLKELLLEGNQIGDTIPATIGNLVNIRLLYLFENNLHGAIPYSIGNLVNLQALWLGKNHLSGSIPASVGNLASLGGLYLYNNELSGSIPSSVGNLTNLTDLDCYSNQLSGEIPETLTNLKKLEYFSVSFNQYSGSIPSFLGDIVSLINIQLTNNQFTGRIPGSLKNLVNLYQFGLSYNHLNGPIPGFIGNMVNLYSLDLDHNNFTGTIPASVLKLHNLTYGNFDHNQLSDDQNTKLSISVQVSKFGNINDNLFTFNGLESIAKKLPYYIYAPQAIISVHQQGNRLSVTAGGTLKNNTYYWFKTGGTDSTIIKADSTFVPANSGQYYVKITNAVATKLTLYSDTISVTLPATDKSKNLPITATKAPVNIMQVQVFPNPATDVLHIHVNGLASVSLINSEGKTTLMQTINGKGEINVSSLAPGVYYVTSATAKSINSSMQKVIIMHP